jgi:hypothetical protein
MSTSVFSVRVLGVVSVWVHTRHIAEYIYIALQSNMCILCISYSLLCIPNIFHAVCLYTPCTLCYVFNVRSFLILRDVYFREINEKLKYQKTTNKLPSRRMLQVRHAYASVARYTCTIKKIMGQPSLMGPTMDNFSTKTFKVSYFKS